MTGLVRYYTGDNILSDASGVSSGTGNDLKVYDGRNVGGTTRYETVASTPFSSNPRAVFQLNGSFGYGYHLRATNNGLPLGNSARSMICWARIDQVSSGLNAHLLAYGYYGTSHSFDFNVQYSNGNAWLEFDKYDGGDEVMNPLVADYRPFLGIWKHYAFTYEASRLKFYMNGILTKEADISTLNTLSGDISVGGHLFHSPSPFYGAAAEIAVYNRVLTPTEIVMIAATGISSFKLDFAIDFLFQISRSDLSSHLRHCQWRRRPPFPRIWGDLFHLAGSLRLYSHNDVKHQRYPEEY